MDREDWKVLTDVNGPLEGELLKGLLEAQGIPVVLNQEGAGRAIGLTIGPLGLVQILVPAEQYQEAQQVLEDFYAGKFESPDDESPQEPPEF